MAPLSLRTYCRAEERISSAVAGGSKLKSVLDELYSGDEFEDFATTQKNIYSALGLTDPAYDFESHYKNLWGDLYGSVYSPKANMIFLTGFGIGPIQQNAFAQEFTLSLLEDHYFICPSLI